MAPRGQFELVLKYGREVASTLHLGLNTSSPWPQAVFARFANKRAARPHDQLRGLRAFIELFCRIRLVVRMVF
jgi:hypothetical protein